MKHHTRKKFISSFFGLFFLGEEFWVIADAWPKFPPTELLKKGSDCIIKKKVIFYVVVVMKNPIIS
jgi:hypothetical protein